jgi:hypothetical protein
MKQLPIRQIDPEVPLSAQVTVVLNARSEIESKKAAHSRLHPPGYGSNDWLKVLTDFDPCSFHFSFTQTLPNQLGL